MAEICTCQWSPVDTTTEDPPHVVALDPGCRVHAAEHIAERIDEGMREFDSAHDAWMARMERLFGRSFLVGDIE